MGYINVQRNMKEDYSITWDVDYWNFPNSTFDKVSGGLISWDDVGSSDYINGQGIDYIFPTPIDMSQVQTSVVIECPVYYDRSSLQTNYHELFNLCNSDSSQEVNCFEGPSSRCIQIDGVQTTSTSGGMAQGYSIQRVTITQSDVTWEQSVDNGTTWSVVYNISHDFSFHVFSGFYTLRRAAEGYTRRGVEYYKDWTIKVDGGENLLKLTEPYYTTIRHYTASNSSCVTGGDVFVTNYSYPGYCSSSSHVPFETADSWEFRTKIKYSGGSGPYRYVLYHSGSSWDMGPIIQIINGESGITDNSVDFVIPIDGISDGYTDILGESYPLNLNTDYYLKAGFSGTEYYLLIGETGWDGTFTTLGTYTTTLKCTNNENNVLSLFGDINGNPNRFVYGSMYMKDTCVYINGQKYWEAVTKDNSNTSSQNSNSSSSGNTSIEGSELGGGGWD